MNGHVPPGPACMRAAVRCAAFLVLAAWAPASSATRGPVEPGPAIAPAFTKGGASEAPRDAEWGALDR